MGNKETANIMDQKQQREEDQQTKNKQRTPSDFLKSILGRPINVRLSNGTDYRGILACLDGYMNIAMEQTEEYDSVDHVLKNKYGDCFIRGNNVLYISAPSKRK